MGILFSCYVDFDFREHKTPSVLLHPDSGSFICVSPRKSHTEPIEPGPLWKRLAFSQHLEVLHQVRPIEGHFRHISVYIVPLYQKGEVGSHHVIVHSQAPIDAIITNLSLLALLVKHTTPTGTKAHPKT